MRRVFLLSLLLVALSLLIPWLAVTLAPAGEEASPPAPSVPVSDNVAPDGATPITALCGDALIETTMADWLPGVVAAEMPASFAPEALRAQAVADTDGQYLVYDGQLIRAVFHAASAGSTECSAALWGGDAPYLVSVPSPETAQDVPNYVSTAEIAADAVQDAVLDRYPDCVLGDDPSTWFGTPVLDDSGRVASIPVGSETLTGAQVRALFSLRSAAFTVTYGSGAFTFTVTGSGHGVGMSQYGANVMAVQGSGYADILAHYYPGTALIRAEG